MSLKIFWGIFYAVIVVIPAVNGFLSGHLLDSDLVRTALWYTQKAGLLGLVLGGVLFLNCTFPLRGPGRFYVAMVFLACISLITGIARGNDVFYLAADFLGLLGPALAYWVLCTAFRTDTRAPAIIVRSIVHFGMIMSLASIYNYIVFGGSKVMFPTQIGVPLVWAFTMLNKERILAVFGVRYSPGFSLLFFVVVVAGILASNSRTSMGMIVLMIAIYVAKHAVQLRGYKLMRISVLTLASAALIMTIFGTQSVVSRIQNRVAQTFVVSGDAIGDASVNQRFVEAQLIWEEVSNPVGVAIGHGAGATYANNGYLTNYGDRVHNAHFSLAAVYLRNGVLGVLVLLLAYAFVFFRSFRLSAHNAPITLMYAMILIDCLTSQFIYWSLWLPLISAMDAFATRTFRAEYSSASRSADLLPASELQADRAT